MTKSEKTSICILLDPAHGQSVKGKSSPDGNLKEWQWSRMICDKLLKKLQENGYRCIKITDSTEEIGLSNRCTIANQYGNYFGNNKTLFISIHCNASPPNDNKWHNARNWSVFVCENCSEKSKKLAELLFDEIEAQGIKTRKPLPKQKYWVSNFTVIKKTNMPACLCETLFMDNKEDCKILLSKEGQEKILEAYYNAIVKYVDYVLKGNESKTK